MSVEVATPPTGRRDLAIRVAQRSDTGRVRTENQDYLEVSTPGGGATLLIVADGMGGHRGGATASRLAASEISRRASEETIDDARERLRAAFEGANRVILEQSAQSPELRGMGTTCSALLIDGDRAITGHVGDSRVYRLRDGTMEQLTDDHSLVATMVREGLLTSEEAEVHPRRNVLQRSVGVAADVEIDVSEWFPLEPGDKFLLCSDGLHGVVRLEELSDLLGHGAPDEAVERLVDLALERGAPDNVTVVVAEVIENDPSEEMVDDDDAVVGGVNAKRERTGWIGWALLSILILGTLVAVALIVNGSSR